MLRRAAKIDKNQPEIVEQLESIPGVTVALKHDDILVGRNGHTYWFEIKNPDKIKKNGELSATALKESQKKIRATWTGHYSVVWSIEQILGEIGITKLGTVDPPSKQ